MFERITVGLHSCGNIQLRERRGVGLFSLGDTVVGIYTSGTIQPWEHRAVRLYGCGNIDL